MPQDDRPNEGQEQTDTDPLESDSWSEDARAWYLELKQDENVIAPWLSLEWTGDRMIARR